MILFLIIIIYDFISNITIYYCYHIKLFHCYY